MTTNKQAVEVTPYQPGQPIGVIEVNKGAVQADFADYFVDPTRVMIDLTGDWPSIRQQLLEWIAEADEICAGAQTQ